VAKQSLLLVDADLRSVRVLEVSLRKAGYNVASAGNAKDALAMLELSRPDLVLCDTRLPTMDGFELIQELRRSPELAGIPLMILSSDVSVETKVRGLELGVEDYLTKPIYIKELLARVNIVLQRKRREGIERLEHGHKRKFSGSLSDMGMVDLLQAIDHNKKSGVLYLTSGSFDGAIYFCNGAPVDAAVGRLRGSRAIYRSLLWTEGTFEIDFREIDREDHVQSSMQAVLMEGLRRVDEWGRLLEQLPNLETVFDVSDTQLMARLAEIPDQINSVLREFDGQRSLWQIVDACDADDLETLNAVSKLYFEGLLYNTGRRPDDPGVPEDEPESLSELSDMALPHISSGPPVITHTLAPAWGSVPSDDGSESQLIDDTLQLNIPASPKLPGGMHITPSDAPKRRKARKRKKRSGQSLPAPGDTTRKHAKPAKGKAKADEAEVRVVDESVAEITPSTIAPPPEEAENAAILQAEQAEATTVVVPATSQPPQLSRSFGAGTAPPEFARASQTAIHENPTLDLSPIIRPATPPPLNSTRSPLSAAPEDPAAARTLKSTAPPPLSAEAVLPDASPDFHSDEETTEKQVSLRGSIPPPAVESYVPRKAASPPPLPYVSKPPSPGFGSHRGVTSPGFAAAPVDEETIAAAAAAISEAETAPPPLAAEQHSPKIFAGAAMRGSNVAATAEGSIPPALRSGSPLERPYDARGASGAPEADARSSRLPPSAGRGSAWESVSQRPRSIDSEVEGDDESVSSVTRTSPAPYPASIPARDFEAAILASLAPPAADADSSALSAHPRSAASSTLPEQHSLSEADALRSAGSDASSGELSGSVSLLPAEIEDSFAGASAPPRDASTPESVAPEQPEDFAGAEVSSSGARQLSAHDGTASVAPDDLESGSQSETSDSPDRPRNASHSPLAAASMPRAERDDAASASRSEAAGIRSARPGSTSIPPLSAASISPAARDKSSTAASPSEAPSTSIPPLPAAFASAPPGGVSALPRTAASVAADERDDTATAASRSEAPNLGSARPGDLSAPPLVAATVPPDEHDDAGFASASPGDTAMSPQAAASLSPAARDDAAAAGSLSEAPNIASARPGGVSAPPLAAASVPPSDDEGSETASRSKALSVASARPGSASSLPLAAASVSPASGDDSATAGSLSEAPHIGSVRPVGVSAPPLAAVSAPPGDEGSETAAARDEASDAESARARDFSLPPLAAASVAPGEREELEADEAFGESDVSSAQARDFSAPPIAAASVAPGEREELEADEAFGESDALSARPRDFSAPPLAAVSAPPGYAGSETAATRDDESDVLSAQARDFSAPPIAAASVAPGEREELEADEAFGESDVLAAQARDFSAPPIAAASVAPGEREELEADEAFGESDALSARPRDFSAPPLAAVSAPPGDAGSETAAARDEASDAESAQARDFSAPPIAAASVAPGEREELEADEAFGESDVLSARPRNFSVPPLAAASVSRDEREDSDAAGVLSARARDFSVPPVAAASVSPGEQEDSEADAAWLGRASEVSAPPLAAASVRPDDENMEVPVASARSVLPEEEPSEAFGRGASEPRELHAPPLAAASVSPEPMEESEQLAFSSRTLIEGRDFAMPALAAASLPPGAMAGPSEAELVQASLLPLASSAPANDVGGPQKPEEDFSDLAAPDERSRLRSAAAAEQRAAPPPLPSTGRRSVAPRTRTSPPPLPYSRARAEAEFSSQPPLATATEPPPGAAALSSPLPPSIDLHTSPGGYVAISPEDEDDDIDKRIRAPVQRTAVPPPFSPNAATPNASAEGDVDAERAPSRGVELAANSTPPRISTVTSSVRPEEKTSEPAADEASALSDLSAGWLRDASAPVDTESREPLAASPRHEAHDEADPQLTNTAKRDSDQASVANARGDMSSVADAADSATSKAGDPASIASGRPLSSSQRPQKTSNVISFVPRKRAEDTAASSSGAPADPQKTASAAAPSQGVWGGTSGAPGAGNSPSRAAPQRKRRISRWMQAGGAAATVALAAGLFALRARDAAPQGSLNTAVPEAVETSAVVPPTAANEVKEQALGELEALHKQAQTVPEAQPQAAPQPAAAPQATGATEPTATAEPAPQQAASAEPAKQQAAPAEPAKQQPAPEQQAAKAASDAQPQTANEAQANAAQALAKGRSLEQRGKKQDAINLYAKAVEDGNASSQLLSRMAFLYLNQGKNALAEAAAKRAADADETNSEAWIVLGAAQDGLGKKPAAQQAYRSCAQKGQGQYVTECKRMLR